MRKSMKMVLASVLATSMTLGLMACGNSTTDGNPNQKDSAASAEPTEATSAEATEEEGITTINIRLMNDVVNIDKVLDVYYEKTKDDPVLSKIRLNVTNVLGADYMDKLTLAVTTQEDYDLMFCGSWQGIDGYVSDGSFQDITSYFNNDEYPGLKAGFSKELIESNEYNGKLYSVPLIATYSDIRGIVYREDLREKYNCPEITDWATYETYLKTMKEHLDEEGLVVPWGASPEQGLEQMLIGQLDEVKRNNILLNEVNKVKFFSAISEDGKIVEAVTTLGDDDSMFANFPEGFQTNFVDKLYNDIPYWVKNYCNVDLLSTQDDIKSMFEAGMYAATYSTLSEWVSRADAMKTTCPQAKLGFFAIDDAERSLQEGAITTDMKAGNNLVIPSWSTKTKEVMAFLNWMFASKENHDLFQYGIEGTDWEAVGDSAYKTLDIDESAKYTMPSYSFTDNSNYVRYNSLALENDTVKSLMDYVTTDSTYKLATVRGFSFDDSNVKTEVATLTTLFDDFKGGWGVYGDSTEEKIKQLNEDAKNAGLEKVREEFKTQLQAYIDSKQ